MVSISENFVGPLFFVYGSFFVVHLLSTKELSLLPPNLVPLLNDELTQFSFFFSFTWIFICVGFYGKSLFSFYFNKVICFWISQLGIVYIRSSYDFLMNPSSFRWGPPSTSYVFPFFMFLHLCIYLDLLVTIVTCYYKILWFFSVLFLYVVMVV